MAFYESPRFPEQISAGAVGGPSFKTDIVTVDSGREKRNVVWAYPRQAWDVSHPARLQSQYEALRAHFMSVGGRAHGFRFKDFSDCACDVASGIAVGLTSTTFQIGKDYISGAQTSRRLIRKPIASGFALYDSAVLLTLTTDYTLDTVTGIVTTAIPRTAANLTWAGQFDVPMRYDTDKLNGEIISRSGDGFLYRWDSIPVVEDPNA